MHQSSLDKMQHFRERFLQDKEGQSLSILDIGSQDVNGSYKRFFEAPDWTYTGLDMAPGNNVDIVIADAYDWSEVRSASQDVVISGQALEHIEYFWITLMEIYRVLKPGGLCCLIAPSGGYEHRYPVDCWRFYPDGFRAAARYAGLQVLEAYTQWEPQGYTVDDSDLWRDSVLIATRPVRGCWFNFKFGIKQRLLKRLSVPR